MPSELTQIFILLGLVFGLLLWGRIRYDLVAFGALVLGAVIGLVPSDQVFSGFGHSAVAIIALVLIVSRALSSSGAVEIIASRLIDADRPLPLHIGVIAALAAGLSAIINNVAALALLMPLDLEAARKAKRAAAQTLMPLSGNPHEQSRALAALERVGGDLSLQNGLEHALDSMEQIPLYGSREAIVVQDVCDSQPMWLHGFETCHRQIEQLVTNGHIGAEPVVFVEHRAVEPKDERCDQIALISGQFEGF